MDVKIRNVDPGVVMKIDELAKKRGLSRNEFLKRQLESFSIFNEPNSLTNRLEKQIEANNILMEQTVKVLDEIVSVLKDLMEYE